MGSTWVYAPARSFARFGELYRKDGIAPDGRRLLPPGWVAWSRKSTLGAPYGAGFWTNDGPSDFAAQRVAGGFPKDGFYASGNLGQRIYIVPSEKLVVVRFGYGLARAVAVARYVGARRGDLVAIPRSARQNGRFQYLSGKRRVRVDIPEDSALASWLDATPDAPPDTPRQGRKVKAGETPVVTTTLVYNVAGRPYTEDGLGQELAKLVTALKASGKLDSDAHDLHGLRHTRGVELALAGCSDAEGAAMMGHQSASSFAQYRRQADRIRLSDAAAARLTKLREQVSNEKCKTDCQEGAKSPSRNKKGPEETPVLSRSCDGTASPDRTGDLQSHNLAL